MAARGQAGLARLLQIFKGEMNVSMALTGAPAITDISKEILDRA